MKKLLFVSLVLLSISNVLASKELLVQPAFQVYTHWCWAACCEMVLYAYDYNKDQYDCANYAVGGRQEIVTMSGKTNSVDKVIDWATSSYIGTKYDQSTLYEKNLTPEIDGGRPIFAGILLTNNVGHMVVITGYTGTGGSNVGNVIFKDPSNLYSPTGRRELSYAKFVQTGTSWTWNDVLRLTTQPRKPIPSGIYDWCRIYDGGTTTVTPSTTSLAYTAGFHTVEMPPAHPVSWSWKLIFVAVNGDCIVNQWSSNSTSSTSTWNITGFSLPSNSQWYYNYDGKIPGRVELDVLDSDGSHHLDNVGVVYVPTNLYPGFIVYENNTVSSTQPEVKAHQMIISRNDQFFSGGNITFRSGERIDIQDGITIQNGSVINFTVDPSVR